MLSSQYFVYESSTYHQSRNFGSLKDTKVNTWILLEHNLKKNYNFDTFVWLLKRIFDWNMFSIHSFYSITLDQLNGLHCTNDEFLLPILSIDAFEDWVLWEVHNCKNVCKSTYLHFIIIKHFISLDLDKQSR